MPRSPLNLQTYATLVINIRVYCTISGHTETNPENLTCSIIANVAVVIKNILLHWESLDLSYLLYQRLKIYLNPGISASKLVVVSTLPMTSFETISYLDTSHRIQLDQRYSAGPKM